VINSIIPDPGEHSPHDEIGHAELLMRRILLIKKHWKNERLLEGTFWPIQGHLGLSLSRGKSEQHPEFLNEWECKTACTIQDQRLRETCGVCGVLVSEVREVGLTIQHDPIIPEDPGHVLLPEITSNAIEQGTEEQRLKLREKIGALVDFAKHRILIKPGTRTADKSPTRNTPQS
jgi:hypothetical protein